MADVLEPTVLAALDTMGLDELLSELGEDLDGLGEDDFGEDDLGEDDLGEDELGEDELGEDELGEDDFGEDDFGEDDLGEDDLGEDELGEDELGEDDFGEDDLGEDELGEDDFGEDDLGEDELGEDELGEDDFGEDEDGDDFGEDEDGDLGEDGDELGEDDDLDESENDDELDDLESEFGLDDYASMGEDYVDFGGVDLESKTDKQLRAISKDPFRKKAVRAAALALLSRRAKKGKRKAASAASAPEMDEDTESESESSEESDEYGAEAYIDYGSEYIEDGMGVDDLLEFVEAYGDESLLADAYGASAGAFNPSVMVVYLTSNSTSDKNKHTRDQLIASIPYLPMKRLRQIASNAFRKEWVRGLMKAEINRRMARERAGQPVVVRRLPANKMISVTRSVPMARIQQFSTKYANPTKAVTAVVTRPGVRAPVGPSSTRPPIPATNAARRVQEAAAARKAAYDAAHPTRAARKAAGKPVLSKAVVAQREARRAAGLKVMPAAQRRAIEGRRGNLRGDDMLGELMGETDPTIGQALMSHPFQALLIGTALFGVGALVGKERIIDAGLAVGDAVTGKVHGAFRGARESRSRG